MKKPEHKRIHKNDFPKEFIKAKPYENFELVGCKEFVNVYLFDDQTDSYRFMSIKQIEGILKMYKKGIKKGHFQESYFDDVMH